MMKLLLTIVLAVALMAGVAQALLDPTAGDVESTIETAVGGVAATYMELTKTGVGNTRKGLTLVTNDDTWAYPDYSDGDLAVNGNCLDEDPWNGGSGTGAADFQATISGLIPGAEYGVYVLAFGRGNATEDFAWGTANPPANIVSDISYVVGNGGGIAIAGPVGSDAVYNNAVSIGNLTADGSGNISIWLGTGVAFDDPDYRTQFDGIAVTRKVQIAYDPDPADGAENVALNTDLSWSIPTDVNMVTEMYKVYFDTDSTFTSTTPIVVDPNATSHTRTVTNAQIGGPLDADTYYWRVDSYDPNEATVTRTGDVWTFDAGCTLPTLISPPDTYDPTVEIDQSLAWSSDPLAITHNVVVTPDGGSGTPVTLVNKTSGFTPYGNMTMEWDEEYTWQVKEYDAGSNLIAAGPVWHFKVRALNCNDPAPLAADADGDCIVNLADFAIMASEWLDCNWDDGGKASPCP